MERQLAPVGLEFVDSAPVRLVFAHDVAASPEAVFHALADDVPGWADWFGQVRSAKVLGDGGQREVRLGGGIRMRETILAAKPSEVYAYRVDTANAPAVRALAEEWRLTPVAGGTRVRWTMAIDGPLPLRLALKGVRPLVGRAFRDAVRALERRLGA
ncbi:MAG TPA: SRPBCC family protein [Streptomyces sp.]